VIAIPLVLLGLVAAHLIALHEIGSSNPDGVEVKEHLGEDGHPLDSIPSHPYYTVHDIFGVSIFLIVYSAIVFFAPEMGGYFLEANNFVPANPMMGPPHVAPVWYFTPYYSILRATTSQFMYALMAAVAAYVVLVALKTRLRGVIKIGVAVAGLVIIAAFNIFEAKFFGVVLMGVSVMILAALPWLDQSPVKSIRYRPTWHKLVYLVFAITFLVLGYLGTLPPTDTGIQIAQVGTFIYFGFFLLMPWWSAMGTFKPVPTRVTFHAH
jgi:ubiquinol-cytochrome c reductase cytochrome b subunit